MSDFVTPARVHMNGGPRAGTAIAGASVRSVSIRFDDPQFGLCAQCGGRLARLGDREPWHHVNAVSSHAGDARPLELNGEWASWAMGQPGAADGEP